MSAYTIPSSSPVGIESYSSVHPFSESSKSRRLHFKNWERSKLRGRNLGWLRYWCHFPCIGWSGPSESCWGIFGNASSKDRGRRCPNPLWGSRLGQILSLHFTTCPSPRLWPAVISREGIRWSCACTIVWHPWGVLILLQFLRVGTQHTKNALGISNPSDTPYHKSLSNPSN